MYGDPTNEITTGVSNALNINVYGWCSGAAGTMATASIIFKTDTGQTVTLTANGGLQSGSWYNTTLNPTATNPTGSLPYPIGFNTPSFMQVTGTLASGVGTFVVATIMFGERNPC